ncbi:OB-fold nucleic acid binding domain-containing protein [Salinispira pacifica]|uniref:OB domain-containing protein n=1 Tax=Salinispira pacifica TaxID=1307761 RepID=V5WJF8_9SPIO|nr:OB-fold nucleic acid binding domain-containing protein [Salinispira pacifica]AHC15301.1 hypothetical protein L21SP2_1930 [Salinispira pacifica]
MEFCNREVYIAGYLVSGKEVYTKHQKAMSFISFEDRFGLFETVFFPRAYERLAPLLDLAMAYIIQGDVKEDLGAVSIHITHLYPLNRRYVKSRYFSDSLYTEGAGGACSGRKVG